MYYTVGQMIEDLKRRYKPEEKIAGVIWGVDDVLECAEDRGYECSTEQAEEVVYLLSKRHDCNIGINWDVIDCHLWDICKFKGDEEE